MGQAGLDAPCRWAEVARVWGGYVEQIDLEKARYALSQQLMHPEYHALIDDIISELAAEREKRRQLEAALDRMFGSAEEDV